MLSATELAAPSRAGIRRRTPIEVDTRLLGRFWPNVQQGDGCWLWTGCDRGNGYGVFQHCGKLVSSHVVSYVIHFGQVPDGKIVCHRCANRKCVRPDHLYAGSFSDNVRDMDRDGNRPRQKTQAGRFKGVHACNGLARPWRAQIAYEGRNVNIGRFATIEEAARAYDAKAIELFGDKAVLNLPQ